MGYRDDEGALAAQRAVLAREVKDAQLELTALQSRGAEMASKVRRKRWRLRLAATWRWICHHPKLVLFLLSLALLITYIEIDSYLAARRKRARYAWVVGPKCQTKLEVTSTPSARLFVDDLEIGKTPQKVSICWGNYWVRLVHRSTIPWQRRVHVTSQPKLELSAHLVSWDPALRPRGGVLLQSEPAGALVFVGGVEIGRTPVFVRSIVLRRAAHPGGLGTLLGVAAPGYVPFARRLQIRRGRDLWVELEPLAASKASTANVNSERRKQRPGKRPPGKRPPGKRPPGKRPPGKRPPGKRPPGKRPPGREGAR